MKDEGDIMGVAGKPILSGHRKPSDGVATSSSSTSAAAASAGERIRRESRFGHILNHPAVAATAGAVRVFVVFGIAAGCSGMFNLDGIMNWSQVSAYLGILAVGACLLMIAGEFDLSIGSMIGFSGMLMAIPAVYYGVPLWASILLAFAGSMALGALNGWIVVRTKLPSFIVTLAFLFILRGLTLMLSVGIANRTVVSGVGDLVEKDWLAQTLFAGTTFKWLMSFFSSVHIVGLLPNGTPMVTGIPKEN